MDKWLSIRGLLKLSNTAYKHTHISNEYGDGSLSENDVIEIYHGQLKTNSELIKIVAEILDRRNIPVSINPNEIYIERKSRLILHEYRHDEYSDLLSIHLPIEPYLIEDTISLYKI